MEPVSGNENLKREIGVISLTLAIVNVTVGTGIFIIPAIIAAELGAGAIAAYFVCGALIFLIALCFAELGSRTVSSGGVYTYIETAFGSYAGFIANNIYWFGGGALSDSAIANGLADTLKYFFPAMQGGVTRILFFIFIFGALTILNITSLKNGVKFIRFATFAKLLPLILLVIMGAGFVNPANLVWEKSLTIENVGAASLLLFFSFLGLETPLSNGAEIKNPKRTVPISILLGISGVLVLYISIQLVTQGVLGKSLELHKDAPLGAVARVVFGKSGTILVILAIAISMMGSLGGEILSMPRILYAGARDGLMPKHFAKIHPRFFTPHVAIIFYAFLGFIFAVSGGFKQLAIISSASVLIIYFGAVLAALKLRAKHKDSSLKTFRVPGGPTIPLLAAAGIIWLLSSLSRPEITGIIVFILIFSVIYLMIKFTRKK